MRKYFNLKIKKEWVNVFLNLFIFALIGAFVFLFYFHHQLGDGLVQCASDEVEKLTVDVINCSVRHYLKEHDGKDLLEFVRDSDGKIMLIRYDTKVLNQLTSDMIEILDANLNHMVMGKFSEIDQGGMIMDKSYDFMEKTEEGVLFFISSGSATGNALLANIGPKIPLRLSLVSHVNVDVESKITNYGLNNAMLEIRLDISVMVVIQMPFLSKKEKIRHSVPLSMEVIQGEVPSYYLKNGIT